MAHTERSRRVVKPGNYVPPDRAAPRTADRRRGGLTQAGDLYHPRSPETREALGRLDAGLDEAARAELAAWLREEYKGKQSSFPLGFVAVCHLGPPFVDHRLNLLHSIVDHFGPADPMPKPFDGARMMVRTGAYAFVEVYDDGLLLPVHRDGGVVRVRHSGSGRAR